MINLELDKSVIERWSGEAVLGIFSMQECSAPKAAIPGLDEEIESAIAEIRNQGKSILESPNVQRMRTTFRAMPDMDPSRYRPASEALIRRCLDKEIFRINPLVDTNNLLSIQLQIPLGIYDIDRIEQSIWTYRIGREGESYLTISNQEKNASGKLVIADSSGVIGSPVADSGRAAISSGSKNIMVIAYLPFDIDKEKAESLIDLIESSFTKYIFSSSHSRQILTL